MVLRYRQLRISAGALGVGVVGTSLLFSMAGCPEDTTGPITGDDVGVDAATDTQTGDSSVDTGVDTTKADTGVDTDEPDVAADTATPDVQVDAGQDVPVDTAKPDTYVPDTSGDAGVDVAKPDVVGDAGHDASKPDIYLDAGKDAGIDAGPPDAGEDTWVADTAKDSVSTDSGQDVADAGGDVCNEPNVTAADLLGKPCDVPFSQALCDPVDPSVTAAMCGGNSVWVLPDSFCESCSPIKCDWDQAACVAIGYIGIARARHPGGIAAAIA